MSDTSSIVAAYEEFLESMAPSFPTPRGDDWHLRLIWMPSFRPERVHDVRSCDGAKTITLSRCLRSAWACWSEACKNKGAIETVAVETGTAALAADEPVLALVAAGIPLKLSEPARIGCDGETWVCHFHTAKFSVKVRVWCPEDSDWLRLIEAVQGAAGLVPRRKPDMC